MSDHGALLLILAALHVMESCQVVPHGAVIFRSAWWGRYLPRPASSLLQMSRGRFLFLNPLDVRAHAFVTGIPHILPVAEGVLDVAPEEDNAPRRRPFVPWSAIGPARADESVVWCAGLGMLPCGSPRSARLWARVLNALRSAPPERRGGLADRWLRLRFSREIAGRRLARVERACAPLEWACTLGFAATVAGAVVITQRVSEWLLIGFLGTGVLAGIAIAVTYALAHARLEPGAWLTRLGKALLMAACFPVAFRARSILGRDALGQAHPATVGALLLKPRAAQAMLAMTLRRWQHLSPAPQAGSVDADIYARAAARMIAQVCSLAEALGADPAGLTAGPDMRDPQVRGWCPRCHATYVHASGCCAECRDIALVPVDRG